MFDTLKYARKLSRSGVEYSESHASSLASALKENIYTKFEVNGMIDTALKQFADRTQQMREENRLEHQKIIQNFNNEFRLLEQRQQTELKRQQTELQRQQTELQRVDQKFDARFNEVNERIDKAFNRCVTLNISIIGTLIMIVGTLASFSHIWFH